MLAGKIVSAILTITIFFWQFMVSWREIAQSVFLTWGCSFKLTVCTNGITSTHAEPHIKSSNKHKCKEVEKSMSVFGANHSYFLTVCPLPVTSLYLSFRHHASSCSLVPSPLLTLCLSLLIPPAVHIFHHHSFLFPWSVGDGVKCRCRPSSPLTGSHLLLPPEYF